jgi:hypothetical protein
MTLFHVLAILPALLPVVPSVAYCGSFRGEIRGSAVRPSERAAAVPPWIITFKKGDVSLHRRTVTLSGKAPDGKSDVRIVLKSTERVETGDVNARGEATVITSCAAMEIITNGRPEHIEGALFPSTTRVFSKNGLVIRAPDSAVPATEPFLIIEGLLANNPAPPEAVNVGSTWRTEFQNGLAPGTRVTMISRFLGLAPVFGIPTVKTAFTLAVPTAPAALPPDSISTTGERYLEIATGRVVQSKIEISNVAFAVQGGLIKGVAQIVDELVVPGVNEKANGDSVPTQH